MKKVLSVGVDCMVFMAVASSNAADLGRPIYMPPPVPVAVRLFTWTGCYIGGNIGWGWGRDTVSIPNPGATTGVPELAGISLPSVTGDTKGVLGGGQVGCNYQFASNLVVGIEGDGEAANIKGDVADSVSFTNPLTGLPETVSGTAHAQTDWLASVTGRLGWTWDRVMLYAKGGGAWVGNKYSADLRPSTSTSKPALRNRAGQLVAVSNGPTSARPTYRCPARLPVFPKWSQGSTSSRPSKR